MLKQETQSIDGISFTVTQFPAMRGFTLFGKLVKTIGPALSALSGLDPQADVIKVAPVIASALRDLDPEAASALALEIFASTSAIIDTPSGPRNVQVNTRENVDIVFMGKLMTMFKALAFAVQVNFGDFFGGSAPDAPSA